LPADDKPLTNNLNPPPPTSDSVAVALAHEHEDDRVPKVVAGGRGRVAEQILQVAFQNGIKVREDADLAQLLSAIDIESEIPLEAFAAVSEILVYVYQANNATVDGSTNNSVNDLAREMAEKWQQTRETDT
jgi:flagellar biosynthesis protein